MTDGRDLPWLQDASGGDVTDNWGADYRDFVILDPANEQPVAAYNLTDHPLSSAANRMALKNLLRGLAAFSDGDDDKLSDFWEDDMHDGNGTAAPGDDRDRDLSNELLEYALGSRSDDSASLPKTTSGTIEIGEELFPTITFRRRLGAAGGLAYSVQSSRGAGGWSDADVVEVERANPYDGTGTEIVTFRSTRAISSADQPFGLLRVLVNLP